MPSMVKAIDTDKSFDMGRKKERPEKKMKIGAFRCMSNFVHERACFARIKEKYDDAKACAVIR